MAKSALMKPETQPGQSGISFLKLTPRALSRDSICLEPELSVCMWSYLRASIVTQNAPDVQRVVVLLLSCELLELVVPLANVQHGVGAA